jgi:hypothetical protein
MVLSCGAKYIGDLDIRISDLPYQTKTPLEFMPSRILWVRILYFFSAGSARSAIAFHEADFHGHVILRSPRRTHTQYHQIQLPWQSPPSQVLS